ncbi:hypothetical protein HOP50_07g49430 [Chloropicon primus]|uniref:Uncharacterized protein n=1 Tax=Chloropicon primus TaxID=1764295 RepID=A0A5B8MQW8_9CHLO|nr:hypothetical protein A3770_07p49220 [Chloropicon primus]UPR01621.1 hypothetical protein HOP50_07g49430 [Chloropicon primus]|eukprot:QDZ22404.1 hypothetical protein A3770_07p49220 [Chloropicon primus]
MASGTRHQGDGGGRYNGDRASTKPKSSHQHNTSHQQNANSEIPIDIPLDISFLDTPVVAERSSGGASQAGRRGKGGGSHGNSASNGHHKGGGRLDEKNLFSIVGEIGRLQAIEQEIRSRLRAVQEVEDLKRENASLKQSLQQVSSELDGYKQTAQTQDIQIAKLKKDAQRDMKRVKDLMEVVREKEEVQQKSDDGFAAAMEELLQQQRQLEIREREVAERAKATEVKEEQMRNQAGHQERSLKEIQSMVWTREQQMWEMEQMHRIAQESYQKRIAALEAEVHHHKEIKQQLQLSAATGVPMAKVNTQGPVGQDSHEMQAAHQQRQQQQQQPPMSQIDAWNANLPLLDQDTLISLIKQFLPAGGDLTKPWTADDLAKLDTFLLPHSWSTHYESIYGTIEDFVASHYGKMAAPTMQAQAPPPVGVVVTPMPKQPPSQGQGSHKKGKQQQGKPVGGGGKRKNAVQNRRKKPGSQ